MTGKQTYYSVLGIKPKASAIEIKAAYKSRVKAFYADEKFLKENNVQIQDILIANEILSDSNKRREYDKCLGENTQSSDVLVEVSYQEEIPDVNQYSDKDIYNPFEKGTGKNTDSVVEVVGKADETLKDWIPGSKYKKKKKIEITSRLKKDKELPMTKKTERIVFKEDGKNEDDFKLALDNQIEKFNLQVEKYCASQKNLRKTFLLNKKKRTAMKLDLCTNRNALLEQYDKYSKSLEKYFAATITSIENMHAKKSNLKIYENNSKKASQKSDSIDSKLYSKNHYSDVCKELKKREKQTNSEVKKYKKQDEVFKEYIAYIKDQKD